MATRMELVLGLGDVDFHGFSTDFHVFPTVQIFHLLYSDKFSQKLHSFTFPRPRDYEK